MSLTYMFAVFYYAHKQRPLPQRVDYIFRPQGRTVNWVCFRLFSIRRFTHRSHLAMRFL